MTDIQSNIDININASGALASLQALQRQISLFQTSLAKGGEVSNARLREMQQNLVNGINATGQFTATIQRVKTTTESFTQALEKNKLSMGQYFRYSMGATQTFGKAFRTEFDTIEKVARERVKTLQTQYIKLGRDASGAMQAIAVRPQVLDMKDLGTQTAIAAQKTQLFNQLMQQGSTNLLNFGKNTQWAGRQLMVGFTIPLGIMGAAAAREFQKIEEQVIRLERVYGDFTTTVADTEAATAQIKNLANEFTKYGIAVEKTIGLAADAAAMGQTGAALMAQVSEATRLATLGGVSQQQALETTISLTSAFGVATDDLAKKTNFLNAVENQTVTSIADLTEAIPKAGPVIQQLGGNVEDLTFFLTAMREGGINASESANALKSGLASLINPTGEATEMLAGFGINLQGIIEANRGNVKGIVIDFAKALDTLDPLNRAQAIEQLFGKFQFSRLSTLFQNVIAEGTQASRVLELTNASAAELAALSERELGKLEASPLYQFQGAIERFKAALAPVGEEFMKAVTPLINFGTQILDAFNGWSEGAKQFAVVAVGAVAGLGPILLMTFGLMANGLANIVKGVLFVRNGFKSLGGQSNVLTEQLSYMNSEQLQAAAVAGSLNQVHNSLIQTFTSEAGAVRNLATAYGQAIAAQGAFMGGSLVAGGAGGKAGSPRKMATGGMVPGSGNRDTVPALLTPGEFVLRKDVVARYPNLISGMMSNSIAKFSIGGSVGSAPTIYGGQQRLFAPYTMFAPGNTPGGFGMSQDFLGTAGFSESLRNTMIAFTSVEEKTKLTSRLIEQMNAELGPVADQVTEQLRIAAQEMRDSGQSATHISELFARKEREIMSIVSSGPRGAALAEGMRKFAYPTDVDIRSGGNLRTPGATINPETGELIRRTQYSTRSGDTRSFENKLKTVSLALPIQTDGRATKAHVVPESRTLLGGTQALAGRGLALPAELQVRARRYIEEAGENIVRNAAQAINNASGAASPARRFTEAAGQNIVDGALQAIDESAPEAKKAGERLAQAATNGIQTSRGGRRATKPATTGMFVSQAAGFEETAGRRRTGRRVTTEALTLDPISGTYIPVSQYKQLESERDAKKKRIREEAIRRAKNVRAIERRQNIKAFAKNQIGPGRLGMAGMGVASGLMMAQGVGGPVGDIAGAVSGPLMAISGVASVLGMIPGPAGLVVAALGGLAAIVMMTKAKFDEAQRAAEAQAYATKASTQAIEGMAAATGRMTASQIIGEQRIKAQKQVDVTDEQTQLAQSYLASEIGTKTMEQVGKRLASGGSAAAAKDIANQMAMGIVSGAITSIDAVSIIDEIGAQLNDSTFAMNAIANLESIIGPEGQDLTKDPMIVKARMVEAATADISAAGAGFAPLPELTLAQRASTVRGAGVPQRGTYEVSATETAAFAASSVIGMQNAQQTLDALQLEYQQRMEIAKAAGDLAQQEEIADTYARQRPALLAKNREMYKAMKDSYLAANKNERDAIIKSVDEQTKALYKGTPQAAIAEKAISSVGQSTTGTAQLTLKVALASGEVDPTTLDTIISLFKEGGATEKDINLVANLVTKFGAAEADQIMQFANLAESPDKTIEFTTAITKLDPDEADDVMNTIEELQSIDGQLATMAVNIIGTEGGMERFRQLQEQYAQIDALPDVNITAQLDAILGGDIGAVAGAQQWFDSLPDGEVKVAAKAFITATGEIKANDPAILQEALRRYRAAGQAAQALGIGVYSQGGGTNRGLAYYQKQVLDETILSFSKSIVQSVGDWGSRGTTTPSPVRSYAPSGGGGGGGGGTPAAPEKPPTSFLDSIVKDLRDFTRSTQGLTENFQDSMAAIRNAYVNIFAGLSQQLRGLGASEDIIGIITGMSKEDWDQYKGQFFNFDSAGNITGFKQDLLDIQRRLQQITLGKFVDEQQRSIAAMAQQNTAITRLVGLGLSYADSYEIVADAAIAAAIANAASADEIRQILALVNRLGSMTTIAEASQSLAESTKETQQSLERTNALEKFAANLTDAQMSAIESNEQIQLMLANFDKLNNDQLAVLNQALKDIQKQAEIEIKLKMLTAEGMQDLFNEGFSKAMERFTAQEEAIKIEIELRGKADQDLVDSATDLIEDLRNAPGGLDDLEADLQRISEQELDINKKYEDRYQALDQIEKMNERIAAQQRGQLSLAEALSQGDIAAAARAAEEIRATDAAQALVDQREALQKSQELELENLLGQMGMNREQLEARIRDIKIQIFEIEEAVIEPAQRRLEIAQREQLARIAELTVLGQTREQWEATKNRIDLARVSSQQYTDTIQRANDLVQEVIDKWGDVPTDITTIHTIIERRIQENTPPPPPPSPPTPPPAPPAPTPPAPTGPVKDQAWIDNMARAVLRGDYGNGQTRKDRLGADYNVIQDRVNAHLYRGWRLYAKGGMVSSYLANGGFPGMPAFGTDTVPSMLTPGEFVVSKYAVDNFGADKLKAINNGTYQDGSVYNYNMSVNVKSDANPDEIARTVIAQIKRVDSQRIRGNRF